MLADLHAHAIRLIVISLLLAVPAAVTEFKKNKSGLQSGFIRMLWIWSLIDIVIGFTSYRSPSPKDIHSLIRFLNLNIYLDGGYVVVGVLLAWRAAKPYAKGMGLAVIVQGSVLLVLDLFLLYLLP